MSAEAHAAADRAPVSVEGALRPAREAGEADTASRPLSAASDMTSTLAVQTFGGNTLPV